jgi:MFS superfamily sulfate permease-like transporter
MSEFVQGILVGVVLACAAAALALYLARVNAGPPGRAGREEEVPLERPTRGVAERRQR